MIKGIPFPTITKPAPLVAITSLPIIFLWIVPSNAVADTVVTNSANILIKGTLTFINAPANLHYKAVRNPPE